MCRKSYARVLVFVDLTLENSRLLAAAQGLRKISKIIKGNDFWYKNKFGNLFNPYLIYFNSKLIHSSCIKFIIM
jgi:hypothetical protein